jgi:hypothetical protein
MKVKATLNQCFGECKLAQHCANQRGVSSKTISPDSIFHSWVYTEKSQSCFYTHVYHCRIHKKQVIKPALVLTNIRMVEENVIYMYTMSLLLFIYNKEQNYNILRKMDETGDHHVKVK